MVEFIGANLIWIGWWLGLATGALFHKLIVDLSKDRDKLQRAKDISFIKINPTFKGW